MAATGDEDLITHLDAAIARLSTLIDGDRDAAVPAEEEVAVNYLIGLAVAEMLDDDDARNLAESGLSATLSDRPPVLARDLLISATLARRAFAP